MKKLIALLLALTMVAAMAAGCANDDANTTTEGTTEGTTTEATTETTTEAADDTTVGGDVAQTGAVAVLGNIWGKYAEDEKFMAFGGDATNMVDGQPGAATDVDDIAAKLLISAEDQEKVTEIAALYHGMMLNNFTAAAFKLAEGQDAAAFAETVHTAILGNQWMCGFPDQLIIAVVDGEYVVMAFGGIDFIPVFKTHLIEAYADADIKYAEDIIL